MKYLFLFLFCSIASFSKGQQADLDSLKREILLVKNQVQTIELNLSQSQRKFRRGIAIATLGYSVTIAGGLMLGRKHDDAGKVLLVAGGVTGITGTFLMVDAFRYLTPRKKGN